MSSHGRGSKGGTRGGRDQFKWSDVREDADHGCYIGASMKARKGGRRDMGKDAFWWSKEKEAAAGDAGACAADSARARGPRARPESMRSASADQ